ncbi:MAG: beta-lactamase family protein [Thermomicrobium sp.]|nr:beta-lactamase family protein [Thermomicrobium sp.]
MLQGHEHVLAGVEAWIRRGEIDGAGLMVVCRGQMVLEWYAGDAAPGLPAGPEVLWPLAAISKVYTATTVLALVERGVLTLGMPVAEVLEEFDDEERRGITVRHLLTHTSGLPYEAPDMATLLRQRLPLDELLEAGWSQPLDFVPGTRIGYSDLGYGVLGSLAERVTGEPFPHLVRSLVLEPAGLSDTWFPIATDDRVRERVARVVGGLGDGEPWAMYGTAYGLRLAHPAWGVVASLPDLVRFFAHLTPHASGRLLSGATIAAMTTRQTPETLGLPGWGYGVEVGGGYFGEVDLFSPQCFGHTGASGCTVWYDPAYELLVAFVSNRHLNAGRQRFLHRLAAVLNGVAAAMT